MITLYPSSAHRWTNCAGSVQLVQHTDALPRVDTDASREGACASWVAECVINGDATHCDDLVGKTHKNGWFVDEEMAQLVQPYVDIVMSREDYQAEVAIEHVVDVETDLWMNGKIDAVSTLPRTIFIDDLKYGYGIKEPTDAQLLCYFWLYCMKNDDVFKYENVQLGIFQPRATHPDGHYRTVTYPTKDLWNIAQKMVTDTIDYMRDNGAKVGTHCKNCNAANICLLLQTSVYDAYEFLTVDHGTHVIQDAEIGRERDFLSTLQTLIDSRLTATTADMSARITANRHIKGWAMQPKTGKRKLTMSRDMTRIFTGVDPVEEKPMTPAALIRAGVSKDVVDAISTTPTIGRQLTRLKEGDIAKMFGG